MTQENIQPTREYTGGSVSYYKLPINNPTSAKAPYVAECNDIIEALELNYAEGNVLKALWRRAAARQGKSKRGYSDGLYDAEKIVFFGNRVLAEEHDVQQTAKVFAFPMHDNLTKVRAMQQAEAVAGASSDHQADAMAAAMPTRATAMAAAMATGMLVKGVDTDGKVKAEEACDCIGCIIERALSGLARAA